MRDFIRRGNHANYALGVRGDLTRFGYSASPPPNWGPNNIAGGTIGVSLDEWHLVVGVYDRDAGATRLYVDGVLDTEKTTAIDPYVPNSPLEIGNWYGTRNSWNYPTFSGDIDDVRLYGRALSSEEIGQLFTAGDGAVTFFTSVGPNPTGDNAWRASVDATIVEFDFEEFTNGAPIDVLQADDVAIDVDLCGLNGPAPAGQAMTASAFAYPGAVFGTALLNRPPGTSGAEDRSDIVFRFATPIVGAGAWMFDDQEPQLNQKRMVALDTAGNLHVSPILDNPGTGHMVEGFIGVTAGPDVELTAIAIQSLDGRGQLIPGAFEVDHLQVAIRTCPADLDGNGSVDFVDLTALLNKWGWCTACPADMNGTGDGWVGFDDLVMLLNAWGPC
jgi:hypothetical protein